MKSRKIQCKNPKSQNHTCQKSVPLSWFHNLHTEDLNVNSWQFDKMRTISFPATLYSKLVKIKHTIPKQKMDSPFFVNENVRTMSFDLIW